jgi:hypothetical protein
LLEACADITTDVDEKPRAGLDCARNPGTGDKNVLTIFDRNRRVKHVEDWHSPNLMEVAGHAIVTLREHGWTEDDAENCGVDVCGLGAGVVDRMREAGWKVRPVDFGAEAERHWNHTIGRDANHIRLKPELHDVARALFRSRLISVPRRFRKTWADLMSVQFGFDGSGRMKIEDKDAARERIGRSPDFADSLVISLAATGYRSGFL